MRNSINLASQRYQAIVPSDRQSLRPLQISPRHFNTIYRDATSPSGSHRQYAIRPGTLTRYCHPPDLINAYTVRNQLQSHINTQSILVVTSGDVRVRYRQGL